METNNEREKGELREYRRDAIKAAKELLYDTSYISQIKQAENKQEITRILINARHEKK